jgi:hypothetical protein
MGSATIRKVSSAVNPSLKVFFAPGKRGSKIPRPTIGWAGGIKDGGRVPRQGRHVLDGTLDRMEGASLRGPETLPPWNLVFKWSDTNWYHSGVRKLFHLALS